MIALGIDTGLANFGWGLVELTPNGARLLGAGLVRTKPSKKKLNIRSSSDRMRRIREQACAIRNIEAYGFTLDNVALICIESQSWPRSSTSCAMIGMSFGIVGAHAEQRDLPILEATPQDIKLCVTGKKTSTKGEVKAAIAAMPGFRRLPRVLKPFPPSLHEHPVEALGAVLACRESDTVRAILRMEAIR